MNFTHLGTTPYNSVFIAPASTRAGIHSLRSCISRQANTRIHRPCAVNREKSDGLTRMTPLPMKEVVDMPFSLPLPMQTMQRRKRHTIILMTAHELFGVFRLEGIAKKPLQPRLRQGIANNAFQHLLQRSHAPTQRQDTSIRR